MFRSYVDWLELREKSDVTALTFRDKSKFGWGHNIKIELSDGRIIKRPAAFDPFYGSYIKGMISRSSCYSCPFSGATVPLTLSSATPGVLSQPETACILRRAFQPLS